MKAFMRHLMARPSASTTAQTTVQKIVQTIAKTATLGALGASLLGLGFAANPAFALTTEEVSAKLARVPVYVLGSESGLVLISASAEGEESAPRLLVFMAEQDATSFLARENAKNPDFAPDAEVSLISLEALYQETQANTEQDFQLAYVPEQSEVTQATEVSEEYQGGVPLFYAQFEDGSLVPAPQENGEAVYPMFFSSADLEAQLNNLAEQNPEVRATVSVGVLPLENMLAEMQNNDYETLDRIQLLPDSETIEAIRSNPQAQPQ